MIIIDAMLLKSPVETAVSILYQELIKTNKYKFKTFSTRESAIHCIDKNSQFSTDNDG